MKSPKRAKRTTPAGRLAALEARVAVLEKGLAQLRPPPPEEPEPAPKQGPRCPGCSLPIESERGTCPWCGFVFGAVAGFKRPRR